MTKGAYHEIRPAYNYFHTLMCLFLSVTNTFLPYLGSHISFDHQGSSFAKCASYSQ